MDIEPELKSEYFERPFPLRRLFRRWFVPAVLGFIGLFLALDGYVSSQVVESIYLQWAQRRAQTIAKSISLHAPDVWHRLMLGNTLWTPSESNALVEAFASEINEMNLQEIKVYGFDGYVHFATNRDEMGSIEQNSALKQVLSASTPDIEKIVRDDGSQAYELYVPVFDEAGKIRVVFELYESVSYLDDILWRAVVLALIIPGVLLTVLVLALDKLVNRAQFHIDARTREANELRYRVESFVSTTAAKAAKMPGLDGKIPSRNIVTTLLFSDIRNFTNFSEENTPETVVDFLNRIMTLQVAIIQRHSGDVDKMIGDAILARFDGEDGSHRAIMAAREILDTLKTQNYPRTLGIGVFRGNVISGAIGPEDRRDFTVIGDAVNVASRLCSAAKADELVTDTALADVAFGPEESIVVKGRKQPIFVRRWKVS
ncbi:MAG: adenylate/guanylate cyclase domain-containing protein [Nitrospirae bacterium]|nr:adenylate/guanylate cyclase domain-containing protein [Magnetococcales bacterium]HAT49766.1 adenylate/guanylate cyclase domain-containing protein [Alphaproteobacteria bacterium]